jgi:hypothetical protein
MPKILEIADSYLIYIVDHNLDDIGGILHHLPQIARSGSR